MAEQEGRDYAPVTERGAAVHAARQARAMVAEMRERVELARETYGAEREAGQGRVSAGLAALRAAAGKDCAGKDPGDIRERLAQIVERDRGSGAERGRGDELGQGAEPPGRTQDVGPAQGREDPEHSLKDRLNTLLDRSPAQERSGRDDDGQDTGKDRDASRDRDRSRDRDDDGWGL